MRQGTKAEIELKPRCSRCEDILEYNSCTECHKPLMQQLSTDGEIIYCYGPKGETWHLHELCYFYLENLKCPKCKGNKINRYAKDSELGVIIVNTCRDCKNEWKVKRGR